MNDKQTHKKPSSFLNKLKAILDYKEIVISIIIAVVVAVSVRTFLLESYLVQGDSMEPSYSEGDLLLVDKISYRFGEPDRGDVIILRNPDNPNGDLLIKRIIGLPNETLSIDSESKKVFITKQQGSDSFILEEPYTTKYKYTEYCKNLGPLELSDNEYFVIGDNRGASQDSRCFLNMLHKDQIIGKTVMRAWPFSSISFLRSPKYSTEQ